MRNADGLSSVVLVRRYSLVAASVRTLRTCAFPSSVSPSCDPFDPEQQRLARSLHKMSSYNEAVRGGDSSLHEYVAESARQRLVRMLTYVDGVSDGCDPEAVRHMR